MARQGIGVGVAVGDRPHRIRLQQPGAPIPDGDGGYTTPLLDLTPPEVYARVAPASVGDMERWTSGTVTTVATHIVQLPFHPGVTTETVISLWTRARTRTFSVIGLANPDERATELVALCTERVP